MIKRLKESYLKGTHSAKAVYGIILISASLIGFELLESEALTIAISVFLAGIAIVVADVYSDYLGEEIRTKKKLDKAEKRQILSNALVISSIAVLPFLIFCLSYLELWSVQTAFDISYFFGIIGLGTFGYLASHASGDSKNYSLVKALFLALTGVIVILTKYHFGH